MTLVPRHSSTRCCPAGGRDRRRDTRLLGELHERLAASGEFASAVDISHGRALVRLHGPDARRTLAKVCGIDLDDRTTPDGSALRTSVARIVTDLVRDDRDGELSYLLHCERSSGQFLADMLLDAGAEFGIGVTGFESGPATVAGAPTPG